MTKRSYAHTRPGSSDEKEWEPLERHLLEVANLAARFAADFGADDWARLAGRWHDLGKLAPDWQEFLLVAGQDSAELESESDASEGLDRPARRRGPDHSTAGAIHALKHFGEASRAGLGLASVIAGHHAGLADKTDLRSRTNSSEKRLRYESCLAAAEPELVSAAAQLPLPSSLGNPPTKEDFERRYETFLRMLFSALVDADRLATEAFAEVDSIRPSRVRGTWPALESYLEPLEAHLARLARRSDSPVNQARRSVLGWCQEAATGPQGAYSLTVPTGGGKTLSALAFALRHAKEHRLERVIVALPFISILDQTADVLRSVFSGSLGTDVLLEHHSNLKPERATLLNSLAAENWDAPLVVTTQVQLFESLFSNRPRDCRKLHNLARSVLILDEVQTLPVGLLDPILDQLQQLTSSYQTTVLLTTATQPSLATRPLGPYRFRGFHPAPAEIVPSAAMQGLFTTLERVEVHWPVPESVTTWDELARGLVTTPQVLAIVHSRKDAQELWMACESQRPGSSHHLSALMCPAHRRRILASIRESLEKGRDCRVISTQLIEAGVDVDFPVVYRAMAGLESLAQAAGRCNREGALAGGLEKGRFIVFRPPSAPPKALAHHLEIAEVMLRNDPAINLFQPATFRAYFDRLYSSKERDAAAIQPLREALRFATTAQAFRMIDDGGETVFVPYESAGQRAIDALRHAGPSRRRLRDLQPYGVSLPPWEVDRLRAQGALEVLHDTVLVLASSIHYSEPLGLRVQPDVGDAVIC